MGTVDLLGMINDARALGLAFNTHGGGLKVTGPKTPEAAALVQQLASHKAAVIELLQTPLQPAPIVNALDARRVALQNFVGQVVSDNDMMILYYRAHRAGAVLTSEWMADTLPCDHRVTGYYPAHYAVENTV